MIAHPHRRRGSDKTKCDIFLDADYNFFNRWKGVCLASWSSQECQNTQASLPYRTFAHLVKEYSTFSHLLAWCARGMVLTYSWHGAAQQLRRIKTKMITVVMDTDEIYRRDPVLGKRIQLNVIGTHVEVHTPHAIPSNPMPALCRPYADPMLTLYHPC